MADLPEEVALTSHVGRATFISNAKSYLDIPDRKIMLITAHKTIAMHDSYDGDKEEALLDELRAINLT